MNPFQSSKRRFINHSRNVRKIEMFRRSERCSLSRVWQKNGPPLILAFAVYFEPLITKRGLFLSLIIRSWHCGWGWGFRRKSRLSRIGGAFHFSSWQLSQNFAGIIAVSSLIFMETGLLRGWGGINRLYFCNSLVSFRIVHPTYFRSPCLLGRNVCAFKGALCQID